MNGETFVIDASIAIKWVIEEDDTPEALALRARGRLVAPDLLVSECANILWKKTQRKELSRDQAILAAQLLQGAEIELLPTRSLFERSTRIAIDLNHSAYDCAYLALALENDCRFVTADTRFIRKVGEYAHLGFRETVIPLADAAAGD